MWCRHERCKIIEVHKAHEDDFARARRGRPITGTTPQPVVKRRRAEKTRAQLAADPRRVVLRHEERNVDGVVGPIAIVQCPECQGGGCAWCNETGEMTLMRYHLWKRDCG